VHEVSELGEEFTVNDVLSFDDEDPGQKAARKMDWEFFLATLTDREKSIVEGLLAGLNGSEIARSFKADPSTIRYFKQRLGMKILDFMGPDILREIVRRPGWKNGLVAAREKLACKNRRRN
jgi:FixJ family two-component response regulator